jgi:hypothetical protein
MFSQSQRGAAGIFVLRFFPKLLAVFLFVQIGVPAQKSAAGEDDGWKAVSTTPDLTIYTRPHKGSSIKEMKAVGIIDAAPSVVKRVIEDVEEFPHFMPYVIETRTIARTADTRIGYQRISPPLVGDRDYTLRVHFETKHDGEGRTCYCNRWEAANELGPPEKKGVTRVKVNDGYWLLEPTGDGSRTRATYCIYSESCGSLPAMLANLANKTAAPKLFEAIRKQVKLEKYSEKEK